MGDFRLEELSAANAAAANGLSLKPGQEQFIAPVTYAMADPFLNPSTTWARVVLDSENEVVGFVLANFDQEAMEEEFQSCIWRMNVSAEAQGGGVGRFIVEQTVDEARKRGFPRLTVIWESGDEGPENFFMHVGFKVIGETQYGEKIGAIET